MTINKKELTKAIKKYCMEKDIDYHNLENEDIVRLTDEMEYQGLIDFSVYEIETGSDYWMELRYFSQKIRKTIVVDEDLSLDSDGISYEDMADSLIECQKQCDEVEEKLSVTKVG